MPPEFKSVSSFNLDLEDWYSCHTSDDEAYQDALERNSFVSFYTARGGTSTAASNVYTSIAMNSPSRLADADQALAEMVPEPVDDSRTHHDPPDLDEEDAPAFKRTRSACVVRLPLASPTRVTTLSSLKTKTSAKAFPRCEQLFCASATAAASVGLLAKPLQLAMPTAGPLRVCIALLPDEASVRLQILPSIFCFGDVPLPASTTDYAAVLMGPEGGLEPDSSFLGKTEMDYPQPSPVNPEEPTTPKAMPVTRFDADCSVKLVTRPRGMTPCKPDTPKDQTKGKHQVDGDGKKEKAGGLGFPKSFIQRLFGMGQSSAGDGRRNSCSSQDPLPPATMHELGSELLMASAATAPDDLAATVQAIPVIAGYVQAAPAAAVAAAAAAPPAAAAAVAASVDGALEAGMLDEAADAAHRLSAGIFRNVLTAAGSSCGASTPKAMLSPRDTALPAVGAWTPQRDQIPLDPPKAVSGDMPVCGSYQQDASGKSQQLLSPAGEQHSQSPSGVALELLVGLAANAAAAEARDIAAEVMGQEAVLVATVAAVAEAMAGCVAGAVGNTEKEDDQLAPNLSVEASDCGGLPMPELEQCESPVAVGTPVAQWTTEDATVAESDTAGENANADADEANQEQEDGAAAGAAAAPAITTAVERVLATAAEACQLAAASPRTVSKRAYSTVARLVKKMAPNFRDTSLLSISTSTSVHVPLEVVAAERKREQQTTEDEPCPCKLIVPSTGDGYAAVKPVAAEESDAALADGVAANEGALPEVPANEDGPALEEQPDAPEWVGETSPGAVAPVLFVFGQEKAKGAKHGTGKTRSVTAKAATSTPSASDDAAPTMEAGGRKRKGDDEILPSAKVPVVVGRSSPNASQDGLASSEPPAAVASSASMLNEEEPPTAPPATATQASAPSLLQDTDAVTEDAATVLTKGPLAVAATESGEVLVKPAEIVEEQGQVTAVAPAVQTESAEKTAFVATPATAAENELSCDMPATAAVLPTVVSEADPVVGAAAAAVEELDGMAGSADAPTAAQAEVRHSPSVMQKHEEQLAGGADGIPRTEKATEHAVPADPLAETEEQQGGFGGPPSAAAVSSVVKVDAAPAGNAACACQEQNETPAAHSPVAAVSVDGEPVQVEPQQAPPKPQATTAETDVAIQQQQEPQEPLAPATDTNEAVESVKEAETSPQAALKSAGDAPAVAEDAAAIAAGGEVAQEQTAAETISPDADKSPEAKPRSTGFGSLFGCFCS